MTGSDPLFNNIDWPSVDRNQRQTLAEEIDDISGNRLLNSSVDDLCAYFVEKYRVEIPVLQEHQIVADQREERIDVSGHQDRDIRDRTPLS